ncbi:hypothetical protein CRUP_014548 [Coryphaenoides rupestris]|nr:hypothetical protein CRUP_014548 [Coryphaenoides rupestris]
MSKNQVVEVAVQPKARPRLQRGGSSASLHNSLMRNSIFQLMIHTLDPLSEEFADSELGTYGKLKYYHTMTEEGKFREKASILHKIAKKKCQVEDSEKANGVASRADRNLPNSSNMEVEGRKPPSQGVTFWIQRLDCCCLLLLLLLLTGGGGRAALVRFGRRPPRSQPRQQCGHLDVERRGEARRRRRMKRRKTSP